MANAIDFYEKQSAGLGLAFLDEFEAVVERILMCPRAWTSVSTNQRRCLFRRFPYSVLYAQKEHEILVTAVMDLRRDPVRLSKRLRESN